MVVEAEAGEAVEVAAERHADHVRGDPLDARDVEHAPARFVTDAPRCAGVGVLDGGWC